MKTELWVARDKDGDLFLFQEKPTKKHDYWVSTIFIKLNLKCQFFVSLSICSQIISSISQSFSSK